MNGPRSKSWRGCVGMFCGMACLLTATSVVSAQQMDPNMKMTMPMPMAPKPASAKKPVTSGVVKKKSATTTTRKATRLPKPAHDAAKHMDAADMQAMPGMAEPAEHSSMPGMTMPDDHSSMPGMAMPADHSSMPGMAMPMPMPVTQPREPIPIVTDADRAAAVPPVGGHTVHDNTIQHYVLFDRLEGWNADKGAGQEWEGKAWIGTDLNRVWLRSEGQRLDNKLQDADLEVLYGHSVAAWWDVVAGVRHDFKPGTSQDFAAIGVMGMTPYKYDVEATAYIGQAGQTSARLQATYDTLLTGRLILQSLFEVNLYGHNDARRGIGSGLSTLKSGYRLRYEFTRRFAPYIGIVQERAFGKTAGFRREEGHPTKDTRFVAGIRIWF
jgi:copper resistance protein B